MYVKTFYQEKTSNSNLDGNRQEILYVEPVAGYGDLGKMVKK